MATSTTSDYIEFILGTWSDTQFLEFRLEKNLICVAVFDALPQGLSAAYTYYNTQFQLRSLGTLAILKLIEHAKELALPYVYLGYWIKECKKMSYKINFTPIEGYIDKNWQRISKQRSNQ